MEKHANFKIAISSSKPSQQQSFVVNEQNQEQNLLPNTTPAPAPSPAPNSRGQARNFFKPMLNTNQPTQTTTPVYSLPINQHVPVTDENTNQYRMYQQNLHANPVSSYPVSQGRSEINNYDNKYHHHNHNHLLTCLSPKIDKNSSFCKPRTSIFIISMTPTLKSFGKFNVGFDNNIVDGVN